MHTQTFKRYLVISLFVASFTLSASLAKAQDETINKAGGLIPGGIIGQPVIQSACPQPIALTLTASTPNVVNADFMATLLAMQRAWLNDPAINKAFLYTFQWTKGERCCEITKAILTVKMKANQAGQSTSSSDAGNDSIGLEYLGNAVPPYSERVYSSWPFNVGQTATKTWVLQGAALHNLNVTRSLSFYVQDDTSVQSATLQLSGCCVATQ